MNETMRLTKEEKARRETNTGGCKTFKISRNAKTKKANRHTRIGVPDKGKTVSKIKPQPSNAVGIGIKKQPTKKK